MIKFEAFGPEDIAQYREYYKKCAQMSADLSPLIILGWRLVGEKTESSKVLRGYASDLCWHAVNDYYLGRDYWTAPAGDWEQADWEKIFAEHVPAGTKFSFVPERLVSLWQEALGQEIEAEEDRDHWDYILSSRRIHEMTGKQLKGFRNACNAFEKTYEYTVEDFSPAIFDELRAFHIKAQADILSRAQEKDSANFFEGALLFVLDSWEKNKEAFQKLYGFLLKVDGKCVAYAINEQITDSYAIGIFAAADYDYKGVNKFAYRIDAERNLARGIELENFMDDTGEPNLRYFKEHLAPVEMLKKCYVTYRGADHEQHE